MFSMKKVMISGHFNGFHSGHLDYIKQAMQYGDIVCVITNDKQLLMKKRKLIQTENEREEIVNLILIGLYPEDDYSFLTSINHWDKDTTLVAETLRQWKPDIFFRGYDKTLETMPAKERQVCEELGIEIIHAKNRIGERHSSEIF